MTIAEKLVSLKEKTKNRSTKPMKRLRASLASFDYQALLNSLVGSARRGLERGKAV